tara:strand:- start:60197 stop:61174 length:978 start_codon:yes stop_codon:yes gene_type:complete
MKYKFEIICMLLIVGLFVLTQVVGNQFYFFIGFVILQYMVMATAWNILGGYGGYVNFGSAGFLATGAYTAVALINFLDVGLVEQMIAGGIVAGALGLATGYLTLRLRGVYFAIATLALAIILETVVAHWSYVGGAAGTSILPKRKPEFLGELIVDRKTGVFANYKEYLFFLMGTVAIISVWVARYIENSKLGRGLNAIKDSEEAAECMGVPTLRLKLIATTISGAMMGVAGAPLASYLTFIDPLSAFNLEYAINAIAMPMIGGTVSWAGPVIGALLLGTAQQVSSLWIQSELNLLIVGVVLVVFVIIAPEGIIGWFRKSRQGSGR